MEHEVLGALAMNKVKGNIKVNVIEAPMFGVSRKDTLDDLAALTGATVIDETLGDDMDLIQPEHLGTCTNATSTQYNTLLQVEEIPEEVVDIIKSLKDKVKSKKK